MPSAEEPTYLIEVIPDTTQDFLSQDVDLLVSQIKENLRISNLKAKSSHAHKNRPSPYRIPSRSWADPASNCEICGMRNSTQHEQHRHHNQQQQQQHNSRKRSTTRDDDDPYELLQELLRRGGLIKEAVKRLQFDEYDNSTNGSEDEVEDCVGQPRPFIYERKSFYYESDDEPLPPNYQPLDL
ncbi:GSK-3-binding protein-like [Leptopilina heterotoma]|uniref:GSK-3-binding protein-like n=1 Tax=Leptopilina heterotoma TaxID=63436 RepID=UPI001CA86C63|nr:GSK-3-binding protein-like [Leptopilina heterotoma]